MNITKQKKSRWPNYLLKAGGLALFLVLFFWLLVVGLGRQEVKECKTWQGWINDYPLYQSDAWQIEQCKAHGIELIK